MDRLFVEEELFGRLGWFIKIRWAFLAGLVLTVITCWIFRINLPYVSLLGVGGFIFAYNLGFFLRHRAIEKNGIHYPHRAQRAANIAICADYLSLTAVIHFSGGVENPFIFLYLLHVIIGSLMLRRPQVWAQGLLAYLLFLSVVLLECSGLIQHYTIIEGSLRYQNPWYILAVSLALLVTLLSTIYMSSTMVQNLRDREDGLMQARSMLQKKSLDLEEVNRELREKQQQLVQSEKLVSLGRLSAGMAHEINNPIQFIQGNIRILSEAMDSMLPIMDKHAETHPDFKVARLDYPVFRQHITILLKDVSKGTVRIADIVRDLKKFARAEEGSFDELVDINEAIGSSLRLVYNKVKRHKVICDLDPNLPKMKGSTSKIEQVIVANLINAAEALGDRQDGIIQVATFNNPESTEVTFCIGDNGPGMTDEVRKRLFDPFFTTKQKTGGMGLGLSVVYGIIKDHQGSIDVETKLGEGTTLKYIFPAARPKLTAAGSKA
jgi:signal transduction histidine kinase